MRRDTDSINAVMKLQDEGRMTVTDEFTSKGVRQSGSSKEPTAAHSSQRIRIRNDITLHACAILSVQAVAEIMVVGRARAGCSSV